MTRKAKAVGYIVEDCNFCNIVAAYNPENDGRELHGLLAYGDSIVVRRNSFNTLSTSFTKVTETGKDSEMLYIKGSYNIIENNTFDNGAGESSDGMVTMKVGTTVGNVVHNNRFLSFNNNCKFIYLGGRNHLIEGNSFVNKCAKTGGGMAYAIYLGYHGQDVGKGSVLITHNTFSFIREQNYMAVYANRWGDLTFSNNTLINPAVLLKCNKRNGTVVIQGNVIRIENGSNVNLIMLTGDSGCPAIINNNDFLLTNSSINNLVNGTNYQFIGNQVLLKQSSFKLMFRGCDTPNVTSVNDIVIDGSSSVIK